MGNGIRVTRQCYLCFVWRCFSGNKPASVFSCDTEVVGKSADCQYLIFPEREVVAKRHSFVSNKFFLRRFHSEQVFILRIEDKQVDGADMRIKRVCVLHIMVVDKLEVCPAFIYILSDARQQEDRHEDCQGQCTKIPICSVRVHTPVLLLKSIFGRNLCFMRVELKFLPNETIITSRT